MKIHGMNEILAGAPFFKQLDTPTLERLAGCASNVQFKQASTIFREGDKADRFYVIKKGKVALEIAAPQGGPVLIETLSEGDLLGWSWLIAPYRWHFDAKAAEAVSAIAFDGKCLREKFEANHDLGYQMLKLFLPVIVNRLQATRLRLLDLYGVS